MKRLFSGLALLALPLALAACARTATPPEDRDLSGTLAGASAWSAPRFALVGTGIPNIFTNRGNLSQSTAATAAGALSFGVDLPTLPDVAGVYQIVAYDDTDGSGTYTIGEPFARNRQWLIFSPAGGDLPAVSLPEQLPWAGGEEALPAMTVARGWNLYDRSQPLGTANPHAAAKVTGYDISR
ncbi:hypothetical protein [Deinococcus petrolearius]|uniref:Lipoprotein n=1 Tax=Deinococcus petrolearius TaxID=1751295 RepID=A0ABW1DI36_9DEIO